jgi:hypothetical protein
MGTAESLRSQHQRLTEHLLSIRGRLAPAIDPIRAREIRGEIAKMAGLMAFHLSMEDKVLYPRLLRHQNGKVSAMAKRLVDDADFLKSEFTDYRKKWLPAGAIEANPDEFRLETNLLFLALGKRIVREDRELYPVLEILGI